MIFIHFFRKGVSDAGKMMSARGGKKVLNRFMQVALIAFQAKHIIATLIDDLFGNGALATHGVKGHDAAFQR